MQDESRKYANKPVAVLRGISTISNSAAFEVIVMTGKQAIEEGWTRTLDVVLELLKSGKVKELILRGEDGLNDNAAQLLATVQRKPRKKRQEPRKVRNWKFWLYSKLRTDRSTNADLDVSPLAEWPATVGVKRKPGEQNRAYWLRAIEEATEQQFDDLQRRSDQLNATYKAWLK